MWSIHFLLEIFDFPYHVLQIWNSKTNFAVKISVRGLMWALESLNYLFDCELKNTTFSKAPKKAKILEKSH